MKTHVTLFGWLYAVAAILSFIASSVLAASGSKGASDVLTLVVVLLASGLLVCVSFFPKLFSYFIKYDTGPLRPTERVAHIRTSLHDIGRSLRELEKELENRTRLLEEMQAKSDRYASLASLNEDQARAIDDAISRHFKSERHSNLRNDILFLILGSLLTFVTSKLAAALHFVSGLL